MHTRRHLKRLLARKEDHDADAAQPTPGMASGTTGLGATSGMAARPFLARSSARLESVDRRYCPKGQAEQPHRDRQPRDVRHGKPRAPQVL